MQHTPRSQNHASFNLLDTESGLKIDLFVLGDGALDAMQMERRIQASAPRDRSAHLGDLP